MDELNAPILTCGLCGLSIPDTKAHNVLHDMPSSQVKEGYGICFECVEELIEPLYAELRL